MSLKERTGEEMVRRVEALKGRFDRPGFELTMSGVPYVTELIARNLARDLRVFSLAAFFIFGAILFAIFRSLWVLLGMFIACVDSSASTLIVTQVCSYSNRAAYSQPIHHGVRNDALAHGSGGAQR